MNRKVPNTATEAVRLADKIKMVDINKVRPYKGNPRTNVKTVGALVTSIKRYGFNVPLVVDTKGVIVCGHARYLAAKELKLAQVPVVEVYLAEDVIKRYRLADNKVAELSQWDKNALLFELREVGEFASVPGFTEADISFFTGALQQAAPKAPIQAAPATAGEGKQEAPPSHDAGTQYGKGAVTDEQAARASETAATKFTEAGKQYQASLVSIVCKCCGKSFDVLRQDLEATLPKTV